MDNSGQWTMKDYVNCWTTDNDGQLAMEDNRQWGTMDNGSKWS